MNTFPFAADDNCEYRVAEPEIVRHQINFTDPLGINLHLFQIFLVMNHFLYITEMLLEPIIRMEYPLF